MPSTAAAIAARGWSHTVQAANDTYAVMRSGLDDGPPYWGVAEQILFVMVNRARRTRRSPRTPAITAKAPESGLVIGRIYRVGGNSGCHGACPRGQNMSDAIADAVTRDDVFDAAPIQAPRGRRRGRGERFTGFLQ